MTLNNVSFGKNQRRREKEAEKKMERVYYWVIEDIIKTILKENNINCSVKWEPMNLRACMAYNHKENKIKFNNYRIDDFIYKYHPNANKETVIKSIVYHEIGHYLDYLLNPHLKEEQEKLKDDKIEFKKFKLKREHAAWDYGLDLVPNDLKSFFNNMNERNIINKHNQLEKMITTAK